MKKTFLIALLLGVLSAYAQTTPPSSTGTMATARLLLDQNKKATYDPARALAIYTAFAQQGNAEAMNALGVIYSKGLGTKIDDQQALNWFTKAVQNNYLNAYYNLGMMYKHALGTTQDFAEAYDIFQQGAALNNRMCLYAQGYMLFKGLGVQQSYGQAVQVLRKAVAMNDLSSMYMLGICYRNGYGIALNADSGKYWLTRSAKGGYFFGAKELATAEPEYTGTPVVIQPVTINQQVVTPDLKAGFQKVKHHLPANDIAGEYEGYEIKFDWSGKYVIGQSALSVKLDRNGKNLTGNWTEDGTVMADVNATLTDSAVVFNNTSYSRNDHYNVLKPNDFDFQNAKLQLVKSADTVFITGNLQLYSTTHQEPEKPIFIMLMRTTPSNNTASDSTAVTSVAVTTKTDSLNFIIYPNPFTTTLNAKFTIKHTCKVRLIVSNLMNAAVVYQGDAEQLGPGDYTRTIQVNGIPGTYVCTINYGNQLKSAIVFKH